jgi:Leucine-rich repeat (LRR) protein
LIEEAFDMKYAYAAVVFAFFAILWGASLLIPRLTGGERVTAEDVRPLTVEEVGQVSLIQNLTESPGGVREIIAQSADPDPVFEPCEEGGEPGFVVLRACVTKATTHLGLAGGWMGIFEKIGTFDNLVSVEIRGGRVSDLSALTGYPGLKRLVMLNVETTSHAGLEELTGLEFLSVFPAGQFDLQRVAGLEALNELKLEGLVAPDLEPLGGLAGLQFLELRAARVSDYSALAGLSDLTALNLSESDVADVSPLRELTRLEVLGLFSTQVADIAPLAGLTALRRLDVAASQVADVTPLAGLTNLTVLDIDRNPISDISPIAPLTRLEMLDIRETEVSDIAPLAGMPNLRRLDLSNTQVADLGPLAGLERLSNIDIRGTQVSNLSPLDGKDRLSIKQ